MNRASFLKLLALPVVAPVLALSQKLRGHWRQEFARDVWVGSDGSEITLEEMEKRTQPRYKVRQSGDFFMVPDDEETINVLLEHFGEMTR